MSKFVDTYLANRDRLIEGRRICRRLDVSGVSGGVEDDPQRYRDR